MMGATMRARLRTRTDWNSPDVGSPAWPAHDRARLMAAYRRGGYAAAHAEFAGERNPASINSAIQRFRDPRPMGSPREPVDRARITASIKALPAQQIFDRLGELLSSRPARLPREA